VLVKRRVTKNLPELAPGSLHPPPANKAHPHKANLQIRRRASNPLRVLLAPAAETHPQTKYRAVATGDLAEIPAAVGRLEIHEGTGDPAGAGELA